MENQQLIYIYHIFHKNNDIKENYIGQTQFFEKRKYSHSIASKNSDIKLYKVIREHGGWNNWDDNS